MEYKEKLRLAKEALDSGSYDKDTIEYIFPELKESGDEKVREALIELVKCNERSGYFVLNNVSTGSMIAWLEKQGKRDARYKYLEELLEADTIYQMAMNDAMVEEAKTKAIEAISNMCIFELLGLEKQGEQKPAKNIVEIWKDMRLEVYQQASGNRHEPNYSDDSTKMFSLNDIDEIIEKIGEQKDFTSQEVMPRYSIGDVLCDKLCTTLNKDAQPNFEIVDIRNGLYICDKGSFPISQQDEYELVAKKIEQKSFDYENANIQQKDFAPKAEPKFKVGDWITIKQ